MQRLEAASGHASRYSSEASQAAMDRNRYRDIVPFDVNRVKLTTKQDYINASHITAGNQKWIAAQGPLRHTCIDFWEMTAQFSKIVLMLCNVVEMDRPKCSQYFPEKVGEALRFEDRDTGRKAVIECLESTDVLGSNVIIRTVQLDFTTPVWRAQKTLKHLHFRDWPDHSVTSLDDLMNLHDLFWKLKSQSDSGEDTIPIVHCSAGCGRTCTFIALHSLSIQPDRNIAGLVDDLRKQRIAGVQSLSQFELLHEYAARRLTDPRPMEN